MSEEDNVTISKSDLAILKNAHGLLNSLWNDKDKGLDFKKMVKAVKPDSNIPEIDTIDRVTKPYDDKIAAQEKEILSVKEEFNKFRESLKTEKEEKEFETTLNEVKKSGGFTEDGWQKVIKRMQDKKNPDVEAAAAYVKSQEPKPEVLKPSGYTPQGMNMFGTSEKDDQWEALNKNPVRFADREIENIINNPEKYVEFGGTL